MTRQDLLKSIAGKLYSKQAANDARVIIMIACNISHEELIANDNDKASLLEIIKANVLAIKRNSGQPMAYLSGIRSFFGRDFFVNNKVLIPRPETEILVETAIELASSYDTIIEVGTGSGAIAVSLASELQREIIATDISKSALLIASKNSIKHGVNKLTPFFQGDLLKPITSHFSPSKSYLVIANLPYLSSEMLQTSPDEVRKHEPKLALQSDNFDGLDIYRQLFRELHNVQFKQLAVLIEFDPRQSADMQTLATNTWPSANIKVIKDLSTHPRILQIKTADT